MRIQPITIISKQNFTKNDRRTNTDRVITMQDLYEMEDRINAKIEKQNKHINEIGNSINNYNSYLVTNQNKILGQSLNDIAKLIYMRQTASGHDYYMNAKKSTEILKNNGAVNI